MKILLAEKDGASARTLEEMASWWGYAVTGVGDGVSALQALEPEDPPRIVLVGGALAGMDAIELCRRIRQRESPGYVYILVVAHREDPEDRTRCLNAGADGYLGQPVTAAELRAFFNAAQRILDLQDELIASQENLREQAARDALTGLWNHGAILDILKRELGRSQRDHAPVGLILGDLDHFKQVNDTRGHRAGDQVLCQAARRLEGALRPYDAVGRYGGEEFLVILPGCDTSQSLLLAERLRKAVGGKAVFLSTGAWPLTISLGVCSNQEPFAPDLESLLRAADVALYRAKNAGRNRAERALPGDVREIKYG